MKVQLFKIGYVLDVSKLRYLENKTKDETCINSDFSSNGIVSNDYWFILILLENDFVPRNYFLQTIVIVFRCFFILNSFSLKFLVWAELKKKLEK